MRTRSIITFIALVVFAAACGGDADRPTATAGETTTAAASGDGLSCAALMSLDDVAALFGEPAVFDAEASEEPGEDTVSCVWSSVENPDDLEDLQVQLFQIQVYRGEAYYAPEVGYEEIEPIEGIGDDAFFSPQLGVSTGFKDGDRVAFVTFSVIGMGDSPDSITKKDQVIALLRLVHERAG